MSTKPPSRVVFVGNIPYGMNSSSLPQTKHNIDHPPSGLSEEQISDLFSSAGQVLNFRLVYDRDTGRPKGFGFAEYPDAGTRHIFSHPSIYTMPTKDRTVVLTQPLSQTRPLRQFAI